ncbi:SAM-dependent methyltransferase [Kitasatospora sp. LaBMicrA B282]|uniref:SAM-dependent methyltransferase n=1 Tax=Kitasatospora sp. LaBMicrA B282 TaxID=3420949 RepID=UPI003D131702
MAKLQEPQQTPPQVRRPSPSAAAALGTTELPPYLRNWAPGTALNSDRAVPARIDNHVLGGKDAFGADRPVAEQLIKVAPGFARGLQSRRRFVERALRHLVREEEVREFLIVGAGLPSLPHLHGVVQAEAPRARVVHVDSDPIVLSHLRAELTCPPPGRLAVACGHLRDPQQLLGVAAVRSLLAVGRPVAVVLESALEYVPDEEDPRRLLGALLAGLPQGSWLVLTHATADFAPARWQMIAGVYRSHGIEVFSRPMEQVAGFLEGMLVAAPGLVGVNQWRPDAQALAELGDAAVSRYGAVGRLGLPAADGVR